MLALPTLKQLQYLVVLSEHLNFTRAAEACFVTQSTLSAGLKELEDGLGVQLVERSRQTVMMTPMGRDIVGRARDILAAAQDLAQRAAADTAPMSGTLRLGIIPTIAPFLLPHILPELRARYTQLRLVLREDLTANLLARLHDGRLDFALIALPYATERLRVETLFDDGLKIVGRRDDPDFAAAQDSPTAACYDRLILLEEGHCLREHALQACGRAMPASPEGNEATSLLTLIQMIESGLGVGLLPQMAIDGGLAASPALLARDCADPAAKRSVALVARQSTPRQAEFAALAEAFRAYRG